MQVTNVDLTKTRPGSKMKAYCTITFDDCFVVHSVKVIESKDGTLKVFMPEDRRKKDGTKGGDVAHPINHETRKMIEDAVFAKFEEAPEYEELHKADEAPVEE